MPTTGSPPESRRAYRLRSQRRSPTTTSALAVSPSTSTTDCSPNDSSRSGPGRRHLQNFRRTGVPAEYHGPAVVRPRRPCACRFAFDGELTWVHKLVLRMESSSPCCAGLVAAAAADSDTRLMDAVKRQDRPAVAALLKERIDVNAPQPDGTTALHWAAYHDDAATVGGAASGRREGQRRHRRRRDAGVARLHHERQRGGRPAAPGRRARIRISRRIPGKRR